MSTEASTKTQATALLPPETRLAASRLALRAAMVPPPPQPGTAKPAALLDKLRVAPPIDALLSNPTVASVRETVEQWWRTHPWRPVVTVGFEAGKQAIVPLARRHPVRLLGAAALAGAVLTRWRPWKWIIASAAPALLASMLPTLLSRAATRIPLAALLRIAGITPRARQVPASVRAAPRATTTVASPPAKP